MNLVNDLNKTQRLRVSEGQDKGCSTPWKGTVNRQKGQATAWETRLITGTWYGIKYRFQYGCLEKKR